MIIASNRSLAEYNLSKEPEIEALKAEIQEKSEVGEQLCARLQELLNEYSNVYFFIILIVNSLVVAK